MTSDPVKRTARLSSAIRRLKTEIDAPLVDHPAITRFERLQDLRAALAEADHAYREALRDDCHLRPIAFFEASVLADIKAKELRQWWLQRATREEAVVEVRRRRAEYTDIIQHFTGPTAHLPKWQALRDQCAEILESLDKGSAG